MINEDKQAIIRALFVEGKTKKQIARLLDLNIKTVRRTMEHSRDLSLKSRKDKKTVDPQLLKTLHQDCNGYVQRMHEILTEEYSSNISYSTLTRLVRKEALKETKKSRCGHVPDVPGEEMQQDTSTYTIKIGGKKVPLVCSGLYLRYSKMRYIKFYPDYKRFRMKCFFYEALMHWGYVATNCIIDNTNLAVLRGTGKNAQFVPEMIAFAKQFGFLWVAHEIKHSNRKAGKERNFFTITTNFLSGRTFSSLEDLNEQAFQWACVRFPKKPQAKTKLIPIETFEIEKPDLMKAPDYVETPYQSHERTIDVYGYVAFNANYYWIPGTSRGDVRLLEYADKIRLFQKGKEPIEYPLPPFGVKNKSFPPLGSTSNKNQPKHLQRSCEEEEKKLRSRGKKMKIHLDQLPSSSVKMKRKYIRDLYRLVRPWSDCLLEKVLDRALHYQVFNIPALERIAHQMLRCSHYASSHLKEILISEDYELRESYQKGRFNDENDEAVLSSETFKQGTTNE